MIPPVAGKAGIDFVFSGHDHAYARTKPLTEGKVDEENGIVYYVCGSTGEKKYGVQNNPDFHFEKAHQDFEGIYLTVSATADKFVIKTLEYDGELIDTYTKKGTKSCTSGKGEHKFVHDSKDKDYLTCSVCDYAIKTTGYTGFAKDSATGKAMYFIGGKLQTGWYLHGDDDIYHFGTDGLAHKVTVLEDKQSTCTVRGYTAKCECGKTHSGKYAIAPGHLYKTEGTKQVCTVCNLTAKNLADYKTKAILSYTSASYTGKGRLPQVNISGMVKKSGFHCQIFQQC